MSKDFLTPAEYAERLNVSVRNVYAWIGRGELQATNVANRPAGRPRWRIAMADAIAFSNARRIEPTPPRRRRRRRKTTRKYF